MSICLPYSLQRLVSVDSETVKLCARLLCILVFIFICCTLIVSDRCVVILIIGEGLLQANTLNSCFILKANLYKVKELVWLKKSFDTHTHTHTHAHARANTLRIFMKLTQ